ncbi:MAG: PaaI family thioesterase [candidate division Zixibacteria bacterium]|nr:PaaI family thioesterase [candidate division Zixibacteria bacterium]
MKEVLKYSGCFVCGDKNACGLKARFFFDGDRVVSEITADEIYEGYRGIFHGGIISTLLDEVMIKAILAREIYAVTAEIEIKFIKPVKTGDKIKLTGRVTRTKGRLYFTEGAALDENGEPFAEATGKYLEARPELKEILVQSVERNR